MTIVFKVSDKLKEKMIPIASAYNTSGQAILSGENKDRRQENANNENEVGRPRKDDSELSDSGEQTREDETNENNQGL